MEKKEIASKIVFIKSGKASNDDYTIDAINHYISNLDACKHLKYINYFYIDNDEEFSVTDDIFCKSNKLDKENTDSFSYSIELYSYNLKLKNLKNFVEDLKDKYSLEQNNKLGNKRYYFDEHHIQLMRNNDNSVRFSTAPNELSFKMTQFKTNKSLKNVFGKHLDVVKERVDLFINHPEWYAEKGIPHTLGILLHGPPGSGKTSLIKAIAGDTDRHIFNIKLSNDTTQTQLSNLFFNERVKILTNGSTEVFNIPLDNRIYVMEDIDCDNNILLDREYNVSLCNKEYTESSKNFNLHEYAFEANYDLTFTENNPNNYCSIENNQGIRDSVFDSCPKETKLTNIEEDISEQVTLSFLLNLLDGILETPNRILIMTSNYPEKLDKALIRPGRIDINLKVGYCDIDMIKQMFYYFYKTSDENKTIYNFSIDIIKDITPAKLNQILLNNFNNENNAYEDILNFVNNT
jgi:hypothetical protein